MYINITNLTRILFIVLLANSAYAQNSSEDKLYSASFGIGYFSPQLSDEGITFPDAEYVPEIGFGFTFFASVDYSLNENFYAGLGFNGNYAKAEFIKNATINNQLIDGYLSAGAVENLQFILNLTYAPQAEGFQPYAKLGIGYFLEEVELGDVPLNLTDNVELEVFPDYKSAGLGIIPEVGAKYGDLSLSFAYGLPFDSLTGEEVPGGYNSLGDITSHGLQINVGYRIFLF